MDRRTFLKLSGATAAVLPLIDWDAVALEDLGPRERDLMIHGSPYLGHAHYRRSFCGLTPEEIRKEMIHFRTAEPWRRAALFGLREA
jgi:hypothetical protein